jgi:hypothetical protein
MSFPEGENVTFRRYMYSSVGKCEQVDPKNAETHQTLQTSLIITYL